MEKRFVPRRAAALLATVVGAALVVSCGDGSGTPTAYSPYAGRCASPRPGVDQQGTLTDEKNWLRAWTDDLYLWYRDVDARTDIDPAPYTTTAAYFDVLKTPLTTASGHPKDKFHFFMSTADWVAFSQSGTSVGYGIQFVILAAAPPRDLRIGFVELNSPGATSNPPVVRGAKVTAIDGAQVINGDKNVLNAGLSPTANNATHTFDMTFPDNTTHAIQLTATNFKSNPVPVVQIFQGTGTSFGYILFNDHIATSEDLLVQAISQFKRTPQITELILDMRYNGGGFVSIASELAYMISGPTTGGKPFEMLTFNDKHPTIDPVAGRPIAPTPFLTVSQGFTSQRVLLPSLGLKRVFVLTDPGTCSASEAVMNGLRGVDVDVVAIGTTTCGKPYGFYATDNCGTTWFSIQFQGVNAKGFGDYSDGFVPGGTGTGVAGVPGCIVAEDFTHELGDPADARVVAAMNWAAAASPGTAPSPGTCPPPPAAALARQQAALSAAALGDAIQAKPAWRENRILVNER